MKTLQEELDDMLSVSPELPPKAKKLAEMAFWSGVATLGARLSEYEDINVGMVEILKELP